MIRLHTHTHTHNCYSQEIAEDCYAKFVRNVNKNLVKGSGFL